MILFIHNGTLKLLHYNTIFQSENSKKKVVYLLTKMHPALSALPIICDHKTLEVEGKRNCLV